jgi:hypothetical protein
MHSYRPSTPRVALGLAAAAMSALTLSAFVLVPARTEPYNDALAMRDPGSVTISCTTNKSEHAPKRS